MTSTPNSERNLRAVALGGVGWTALGQWGARAASFVAILVLARLLTPRDFGVIAAFLAVVRFAQAVQGLGLTNALVQRPEITERHWSTAFWAHQATAGSLTVVLVVTASQLSAVFGRGDPLLLAALSLSVPVFGFGIVHEARLSRQMDFRSLGRRTLVASVVSGAAAVGAAAAGLGAWSLVVLELTRVTVGSTLLWRATGWLPSLAPTRSSFQELWSYARSVLATDLLAVTLRRTDDLVISTTLGAVALGYYNVAYRALDVSTEALSRVASVVAVPVFSRVQGDRRRLRHGFYQGAELVATVAYPAFALLAVLADEAVLVVFGETWAPAAPALRWLALAGLLHSVLFLNTSLLLAAGHPATKLRLALVDVVVTIPAFLIGARWGIEGVAAGYAIANIITTPVEAGAAIRKVGLSTRHYLSAVARPTAIATAASIVAQGIAWQLGDLSALLRLLCAGLAAGLIALVATRLLLPHVYKDVRNLVRP